MIPRSLFMARSSQVATFARRGTTPRLWQPRPGVVSTTFDYPAKQKQMAWGIPTVCFGALVAGSRHNRRSFHSSTFRCDPGRKSNDDDDLHDVSSTAAALAYGSLRKQGTIRNLRLQPKPNPKPKQTNSPKEQPSEDSWTREALAQRGAPPPETPSQQSQSNLSSATSSSPIEGSEPPSPPPDRAEDLLKLRSLEQADKSSPRAAPSTSDATDPQMVIDLPPPNSKKGEAVTKKNEGKKSEATRNETNSSQSSNPHETTPSTTRSPAVSAPGEGWAEYLRESHQILTPVAHLVDTHAFAQRLLQHGWSNTGNDQAQSEEVARALAEAVEKMLVDRLNQTRRGYISSVDVEYEFFVFRLALNEVKTELEVRARNDGASLRSMTQTLQREVDRLNQKAREDLEEMQHTIQGAMNDSKTEVKGQQNDQEQTVQDLKHKLTIVVSTLKTGLEHSLKWDLSRRAFLLLFGQICFFFTIFKLIMPEKEKKVVTPKQAPITNRPQSAEDIGLVPHYEQSGALTA